MIAELYNVCKLCLFDGVYLFYGLFVFVVSIAASKADSQNAGRLQVEQGRLPPIAGGELLYPSPLGPPGTSKVTDMFGYVLGFASFSFFLRIANSAIQFIRTIFLMTDNPTPLRSFLRYFNIYYLIIVLPAAFMPPVSHPQRAPDFQLLAAVVLLICVNALGDVISVRVILGIFKKFEPLTCAVLKQASPWESLRNEVTYYLAVVRGGLYSFAVLIGVLVCSSILYGVQIGQMALASPKIFSGTRGIEQSGSRSWPSRFTGLEASRARSDWLASQDCSCTD
jgi:hypothetical protein